MEQSNYYIIGTKSDIVQPVDRRYPSLEITRGYNIAYIFRVVTSIFIVFYRKKIDMS